MDPEPPHGSQPDLSAQDSLDLAGPALILTGFAIAVATIGVPTLAVLSDRPARGVHSTMVQERDGSALPSPFAITRLGEPAGGNPGGQPE
ncbi:putative conserved membrane protein [Synechococcus sp. RS9909]|nr:putative conserved membrane protein [Synechococcus sp. RS9909]